MADDDAQVHSDGDGVGALPERSLRQNWRSRTGLDEPVAVLLTADISYWSSPERGDQERQMFLEKDLKPFYLEMVDEYLQQADECLALFNHFRRRHERWRRCIIMGTGAIAILNALSAFVATGTGGGPPLFGWMVYVTPSVIAIVTAVAAALLAILANLESFGNYAERAHAHREARELLLDGYRQFTYLWKVHVDPFGSSAQACVNAGELFRRISAYDIELRRKAKDLTQPRAGQGGA